MTTAKLLFVNILLAIFNGFACGLNAAFLATGNSTIPVLTGAVIAMNGGVAIWIAKVIVDRVGTVGQLA